MEYLSVIWYARYWSLLASVGERGVYASGVPRIHPPRPTA